jgi:asparagine synthase (glutamine-hydrolysing)
VKFKDLRHLGIALSPPGVRKQLMRVRERVDLPWLRRSALADAREAILDLYSSEPLDWAARTEFWQRLRLLSVCKASGDLLAADYGSSMAHPLLDPTFLATVACRGGRYGFGSRTQAMQILFGGMLPAAVLQRADKARFDGVFWQRHAREFIGSWSGDGIPSAIVDEVALRRAWSRDVPNAASGSLLQTAFLHQHRETASTVAT